jgi:hypothetical protein
MGASPSPMSDPTLSRLQGRAGKGRSNPMVAIVAAIVVAAIGALGLYALTGPHGAPAPAASTSVR